MLSSIRARARRVFILVSTGALLLSATPAAVTAQDAEASGEDPLTAAQLSTQVLAAWNDDDRELLQATYAADAVHTAAYYDRTQTYEGADEIVAVAMLSTPEINPIGPILELPAGDGRLRWAQVVDLGNGTACLFDAEGGKIVRHDCLLPETSRGDLDPFPAMTGDSAMTVEEITALSREAWGGGTMEQLERAYAPDAVHSAVFRNNIRRYEGLERIFLVTQLPGKIAPIGEVIEIPTRAGELAWASATSLGGGTLCLFRARDGRIVRHDCLIPARA